MNIISPEIEFELPYGKNKEGNYPIIPNERFYSGITEVNKKRFPNGYIYLIKIKDQDVYKLGVSQNVKRRLQDIASGLPYQIEILSIHYFENVYDIEENFSKKIKNQNIRKEWYSLSINQAKEIMIELHNLNITNHAPY